MTFRVFPQTWRRFGSYSEARGRSAAGGTLARVCLLGPMSDAGTATADTLVQPASLSHGTTLAGRGSILAHMLAAYRARDPISDVFLMPVADGAGTPATGEVTFTGPATAAGTLFMYINRRLVCQAGQLGIAVANALAAADLATAVAAAINAQADLPVTATSLLGVLTLAARQPGTLHNFVDVRFNLYGAIAGEQLPAGIGVTPAALTSTSGNRLGWTVPGATDANIATAITNLGNVKFKALVCAWPTKTAYLADLGTAWNDTITGRWSPIRKLRGHIFAGYKAADYATIRAYGATFNDRHLSIVGDIHANPTSPWELAAQYAAEAVMTLGNDPAVSVDGQPLPDAVPAPLGTRLGPEDLNALLFAGITPLDVNSSGESVLVNGITTYQTNESSQTDTTWHALNTPFTVQAMLEDLDNLRDEMRQYKLADDGTQLRSGQRVMTPKKFKLRIVGLAEDWQDRGLIENLDVFVQYLDVQRNAINRQRLDTYVPPDLMNQLGVMAFAFDFLV